MNQSLARFNSVVADGDFEVLTVEQCVNRFAVDFLTGQQTVVVLSNSLTWNDQYPIKFTGQGNSPSSYDLVLTDSPMLWMCLSNYTRACTKEIVQSQITNWQVTDTRWEGPKWAVSVPTDNGTTTYTKKSYSGCSLTSTSECSDLEHLENLAWLDVPPTGQLFQKYLDISDWRNETWAKEVTFQNTGSQCVDDRIEGDMGPIAGLIDIFSQRYTVHRCVRAKTEQHRQLLLYRRSRSWSSFALLSR